jgi:hypothetical protein
MNIETLKRFLVDANKSTYANKDAPKVAALRPRSEDYHFEKDGLTYHDTYFGGRDFMGEEIVYEGERPVWGMNYFGFMLDKNLAEREVYSFLRLTMMQEYDDVIPVRGPGVFIMEDKTYRLQITGDLANFSGTEEILFNDIVVYRCYLHGGMIG